MIRWLTSPIGPSYGHYCRTGSNSSRRGTSPAGCTERKEPVGEERLMTSASIARREETAGGDVAVPPGQHPRCGPPGGRFQPDDLPGAERASERARVHQGPRARRDRRTALPPEPRRQDARHPPVADHRGAHRRGGIAPRTGAAASARSRRPPASAATTRRSFTWRRTRPSAISAAAEDLLGQEVEGVVIVAPQLTVLSGIAPLLAPVPIVTSLGELRNAGGSPVPSADAGSGARMAMRYLHRTGAPAHRACRRAARLARRAVPARRLRVGAAVVGPARAAARLR